MPDKILDSEELYRAVPDNPNMWKAKENRPSSALFKDSKGISVDRDGGREESAIVENFQARLSSVKAVVKISAKKCRELGTEPKPDPVEDNEHHALILNDDGEITLKPKSKPTKLAKTATVVYFK